MARPAILHESPLVVGTVPRGAICSATTTWIAAQLGALAQAARAQVFQLGEGAMNRSDLVLNFLQRLLGSGRHLRFTSRSAHLFNIYQDQLDLKGFLAIL